MALDTVKIIDQAREKAEERLLLEVGALLFVRAGKNKDEDGQNLRQVMNFGLVIVDTRSISVILDDVNNEPRHCIQWLECVIEISCSYAFDVAVDAGLCAYPEEERGNIF